MSHRANGGLGIGLSLVKSLVELHGGTVSANSEGIGRGAEFTVTLPALVSAHPVQRNSVSNTEATPSDEVHRVLIVDDNRDAADSLATLLRLKGHEVTVAYDGTDGLKVAEEVLPSIVFLDIGLPTLDGYEVCRQLRAHYRHTVQIVAMTGYGMQRDKELAQEAGFDAHTVKPVDFSKIREILRNAAPQTGLGSGRS